MKKCVSYNTRSYFIGIVVMITRQLDEKAIGDNIRMVRKSRRMTLAQLARSMNVNPSYICNIEHGREKANLNLLVEIGSIMGCSVDLFISQEYDFNKEGKSNLPEDDALEKEIIMKVRSSSVEKKRKIKQLIDLLD